MNDLPIITVRDGAAAPGPVLHVWQRGALIAVVPLDPGAALELIGEIAARIPRSTLGLVEAI